jgi:uncharacterized protein (TIGR03435 family)
MKKLLGWARPSLRINMPLRQLIVRACQVQPYQVLGGPPWVTSGRFDVTAKAKGKWR